MISKKDIENAVISMRRNQVKPRTIKTKRQARMFNTIDKVIGLEHTWKVGDEYYLLACSEGNFAVKPE